MVKLGLPAASPENSVRRRYLLAIALYLVATAVYFACASREVITSHTQCNHYALLADAWLRGRLDLGHPPPAYTQNNDFASFQGKHYVSFPPFPALILLPFAKLAGTPENLRDGQIWLWLAGVGPAVLFLALEKMGRLGFSDRKDWEHWVFAALLAFGSVYFFSAEQGTVWFSAHVVAVALCSLYLLFALNAERPVLAGTAVGLLFATRPPVLLAGVFFVLEAVRVSLRPNGAGWRRLDLAKAARLLGLFLAPLAAVVALILWHNHARFGRAMEFGHALLNIGWRGRIDKWGLFAYHYLGRNLGIVLSGLPFVNKTPPYFQVNLHGLALWFTTPLYLWLIWPRRVTYMFKALAISAAPVILMDLLYQNSGWVQFGYRFSNDYAVFLFAMLAIAGHRMGPLFWSAAIWSVGINTAGALTFGRPGFEKFYFNDSSQQVIYQPD